jgi:hypothetical protein
MNCRFGRDEATTGRWDGDDVPNETPPRWVQYTRARRWDRDDWIPLKTSSIGKITIKKFICKFAIYRDVQPYIDINGVVVCMLVSLLLLGLIELLFLLAPRIVII